MLAFAWLSRPNHAHYMGVISTGLSQRLPILRQIFTISTASLSRVIDVHLRNNRLIEARKLFDQNPTSLNTKTWNTMIGAYVNHCQIEHAHQLFVDMPDKDSVSWNIMLSGLNKNRNPREIFTFFIEMQRSGLKPTEHTLTTVINAVLDSVFRVLIPQIHSIAVCLGLNSSGFVGSALLRGYAGMRDLAALKRVFNDISVKDITSWNALISGYVKLGCTNEAMISFDAMPEKNSSSWTRMISGYITVNNLSKARSLFNEMDEKNVISWTMMISGYVQNGKFLAALKLYHLMVKSGTKPNHYTYSSVLDGCSGCSSLITGQQIHSSITKYGIFGHDVISTTSLVDMYAKCGDIDTAFCVFQSMPVKNLVSWNSIIGGFAWHGLGSRTLVEFSRMIASGFIPDEVTFVNLLSACAHAGLVEEGERQFKSMVKYGIEPEKEHYACMVDLYGRSSQLEKAEELIKGMPFEPDVVIWGALLGACGLHSSLKLGEFAAQGISKLKSDHPAAYSILTKIHGEKGVWSSVMKLRRTMKIKRVQKQKASSWLEATH